MQRSDCYWLAIILAVALAFSIWGLPYFTQLGHPLWSLVVYGFLAVMFLYGRANRSVRERKVRGTRNGSPQEERAVKRS